MPLSGLDCPAVGRSAPPRFALLLACLLSSMVVAGSAQAAADCTAAAGGVAFGAYNPLVTTADDSTGTVTVTCTNTGGGNTTVNYTLALSTGVSGAYSQRHMKAGTPMLNYNLYRDSARSVVWGNGSGGTSQITGSLTVGSGAGNGTRSATYTVYGRVQAQQDAAPGTYSDSIVITLTF
jgi:spore coat protein U-like protein